jgi:histidinol-phosphatase (PHP family)
VNEPHPRLEVLREASKRKIPLVLGSDAHSPEHVGWQFADAVLLAKEAGYGQVAAFKTRRLETWNI